MSSTSLGDMFSPFRMMMSFARPVHDEVGAVHPSGEVPGPEIALCVEGIGLIFGMQIATSICGARAKISPSPR